MSTESKHCQNCGYELTPYHNYCPNCGQKVDDKLSMRVLFHNTVMNYFSVDARFFRSFIPLLVRPGFLAKKFVSGKRLMYLHPAQFYLFASIVFFFIFSISTRATQQEIEKNIRKSVATQEELIREVQIITDSIIEARTKATTLKSNAKDSVAVKKITDELKNDVTAIIDTTLIDTIPQKKNKKKRRSRGKQGNILGFNFDTAVLDSLNRAGAPMETKLKAIGYNPKEHGWFSKFIAQQVVKFIEKQGDGIVKAFMDTIPVSMFFLIPVFALLLKLLYRKRGRFAHHMVFSFYFFAFIFLSSSIMIIGNYIINIPVWVNVTLVLSMLIYLFISLRHFYEQGFFKTFFKTGILSFIYLIFVIPLTFVLLWVVSFFLY
ncbi:MAG: DUF3667 domain-containing protein [Bacteroidota bacterium]